MGVWLRPMQSLRNGNRRHADSRIRCRGRSHITVQRLRRLHGDRPRPLFAARRRARRNHHDAELGSRLPSSIPRCRTRRRTTAPRGSRRKRSRDAVGLGQHARSAHDRRTRYRENNDVLGARSKVGAGRPLAEVPFFCRARADTQHRGEGYSRGFVALPFSRAHDRRPRQREADAIGCLVAVGGSGPSLQTRASVGSHDAVFRVAT